MAASVSRDIFESALLSTLEGAASSVMRADPEKLYMEINRFDLSNDGTIRAFKGSRCVGIMGNYRKWRNDYDDAMSIHLDHPILVEVKLAQPF